jgi:hypothetical protein
MSLIKLSLAGNNLIFTTRESLVSDIPAELIVLVDFKAIYLGVPPGIFAGFPGVAHFLSFEEICQYPRVKSQIPGVP